MPAMSHVTTVAITTRRSAPLVIIVGNLTGGPSA